MDDKELLGLAAKAAGYTLEDHHDINGEYWPWCIEEGEYWCPLTDDGDALRLAVKLGLYIGINRIRIDHGDSPEVTVYYGGVFKDKKIEMWTGIDDDYYTATRRAIVRAAAEIGRAM